PHFKDGQEGVYLLQAFQRDFELNGPSLLRLIRVLLNGWQMRGDRTARVRKRLVREAAPLASTYAGAVWAIGKFYIHDPRHKEAADRLLDDLCAAFGWKARLIAP